MKKIKVDYSGGSSRYSNKPIDYMLAKVDDIGIELYAEATPIEGDETGTYRELKNEILWQAKKYNIDFQKLAFFYDDEEK